MISARTGSAGRKHATATSNRGIARETSRRDSPMCIVTPRGATKRAVVVSPLLLGSFQRDYDRIAIRFTGLRSPLLAARRVEDRRALGPPLEVHLARL